MRYLIIVTGVAYGHLTREEAIIDKIKKLDKKAEIFVAGYETSHKYFKGKYDVLKLKPMFFPDKLGKVQFFETLIKNYKLLFYWGENKLLVNNFIKEYKPDVVISDWEPFAIFVKECKYLIWNYKPKFAKFNSLTLLFEKLLFELGYFISWIFNKKIILPSLKKEENVRNYIYTNLIVRKTPKEVKSLNKYRDSILVMIGGADFGLDLAKKIKNISKDFNEKFVIFGYKCKGKKVIGYRGFKKNYLEYLKSCKGVISLGGHSGVSESVFFKKPNLVFPIKGWIEQFAVVEEFKDYIGVGNIESSEEELKVVIGDFLKDIPKLKKKLNSLRLTNGADEIAKIIYEEANL